MRRLVRAAPSSSSARKIAKSADLTKKKNKQSKKRAPPIVSLDHYSSQVLDLILSVEDLLLVDQHLDQLDDADFIFSIDELVVDDQTPSTPSFHPDAAEDLTSILMAFDDDQQLDVSDDDDMEMIFSVDELLVDVDPMAEEKPRALMAFGDDDTDYPWIDVLEEDQEIINIFMACFDDDDLLQYNNDPTA